MEGYTHSDTSLSAMLERVKAIALAQSGLVDEAFAVQQSQITNLHTLGMVHLAPQKASTTGGIDNASTPNPVSLLEAIGRELSQIQISQDRMRDQIENGRFIGEALFRQGAEPALTTANVSNRMNG